MVCRSFAHGSRPLDPLPEGAKTTPARFCGALRPANDCLTHPVWMIGQASRSELIDLPRASAVGRMPRLAAFQCGFWCHGITFKRKQSMKQ